MQAPQHCEAGLGEADADKVSKDPVRHLRKWRDYPQDSSPALWSEHCWLWILLAKIIASDEIGWRGRSMAKILIVYGTNEGQTAKIASRLNTALATDGHSVDLFDVKNISKLIRPSNYDAALIGASVHVGGYQVLVKNWVKSFAKDLNSRPTAFFSVCLGVLQNESVVKAELNRIIEDFFNVTLWRPETRTVFAGALAYSKYSFLVKWWMKRIARKTGGDTDTTKDYEYTDRNAVDRFAREFSKKLSAPPTKHKTYQQEVLLNL